MKRDILFDTYLSGTMTAAETENFEQKLAYDKSYATAYEKYLMAQKSSDILLKKDVQAEIEKLHKEKAAKKAGAQMKWFVIGVAFLLGAGIFIASMFLSNPPI